MCIIRAPQLSQDRQLSTAELKLLHNSTSFFCLTLRFRVFSCVHLQVAVLRSENTRLHEKIRMLEEEHMRLRKEHESEHH